MSRLLSSQEASAQQKHCPLLFCCSPAFTFPHPINPVAYQQILSQQRGLGSAFGHTPPLIQPSPTFLAQQPMALTSISSAPTQLSSSSSNCLSDTNQVCGYRAQELAHWELILPPHRLFLPSHTGTGVELWALARLGDICWVETT